MTDVHPDRHRLELFMRGRLLGESSKDIVLHLLSGCEACRRIARESFPCDEDNGIAKNAMPENWQSTAPGRYAQVFERVLPEVWEAEDALRVERTRAPELFEELERHPHERRLLLIGNSRRFRSWALCEWIVEKAFKKGFDDPAAAVELGQLSIAVAELLDPEESSAELLEDVKCRAHSILGNALRISGALAEANEHFGVAEECLNKGTGDRLERARYLELKSYLVAENRKFSLALALLDEAIRIYRVEKDYHRYGRALIIKGHHLGEKGDVSGAVASLRQGVKNIDVSREPRLELVAKHNLVRHLYQAGRYHQALALLPETRELHRAMGSEMDRIRFRWLEGTILRDSSDLAAAESILEEVKDFFVERRIAHDSALVSLDIAAIYFRQHRMAELKQLAGQMLTIFHALRINREAIAALVLFQKAVEVERVTLGLMRDLAAYLKNSRNDSRLPFRPSTTN